MLRPDGRRSRLSLANSARPAKIWQPVQEWKEQPRTCIQERAAKDAGLTVDWIEYADFNLDIYGNGLVTSERLIEEQPELVRNFVEATYEGYAFVLDNPESAAAIVVDQYPVLEPEVTLQQVREISALISGPDSLGWLDREKVARTLEFISSSYELDTSISVDEIYTAQFLE